MFPVEFDTCGTFYRVFEITIKTKNIDDRAKLFNEISNTGNISQDQWLSWAMDHITAKAGSL
jgi:hypothetical protein